MLTFNVLDFCNSDYYVMLCITSFANLLVIQFYAAY